MKIIVYHSYYGCETGCCGHRIDIGENPDKDDYEGEFEFDHPYSDEDIKEWAKKWVEKKFGKEHVADLDWDNCDIVTVSDCNY